MSTSFYAKKPQKPPCECCGRDYPEPVIHIGNSAGGWKFNFRSYDEGTPEYESGFFEAPIKSASDWRRELDDWAIYDEYNKYVSLEKFWNIVNSSQDQMSHSAQYPQGNYVDSEGYEFSEEPFW